MKSLLFELYKCTFNVDSAYTIPPEIGSNTLPLPFFSTICYATGGNLLLPAKIGSSVLPSSPSRHCMSVNNCYPNGAREWCSYHCWRTITLPLSIIVFRIYFVFVIYRLWSERASQSDTCIELFINSRLYIGKNNKVPSWSNHSYVYATTVLPPPLHTYDWWWRPHRRRRESRSAIDYNSGLLWLVFTIAQISKIDLSIPLCAVHRRQWDIAHLVRQYHTMALPFSILSLFLIVIPRLSENVHYPVSIYRRFFSYVASMTSILAASANTLIPALIP